MHVCVHMCALCACFECAHVYAHTLHVKVRGGFRHLSYLPLKLFSWDRVSHCVCVCMFMCAWRCVCMYVEARGFCWVSFSIVSTLLSWDRVSHWTWKLTGSARLTGWQAPGICLAPPPCTGLTAQASMLSFLYECGDLSSGPHACAGSILPTEPFCL